MPNKLVNIVKLKLYNILRVLATFLGKQVPKTTFFKGPPTNRTLSRTNPVTNWTSSCIYPIRKRFSLGGCNEDMCGG